MTLGGVAEALVATASGLFVAVTSLIPYNYLNSKMEDARREVEEAGNTLEMVMSHLEVESDAAEAAK